MAVPISVASIPPFDPHGDQNSVAQRWQKWLKSFAIFADATGCKNDKQKRQLLLHTAGSEIQDIFYTLTETGTDYKTAADKLNEYFAPRQNTSYNRHIFRQEKQKDGETVAQFVTRLRRLATLCDFPAESTDSFIRDQVIDNCLSMKLRTKLLAERDLSLARTLDIAQAIEASQSQSRQIAEDNQSTKVYTVGRQPRRGKRNQVAGSSQLKSTEKQCSRCGIKGHSSDNCRCSRTVTCYNCGVTGHFALMCRSKTQRGVRTNANSQPKQDFRKRKSRKNPVRYVNEQVQQPLRDSRQPSDSDSDDAYTDEYAYALQDNEDTSPIVINGLPVGVIIDSGASCNIVNSTVASQLRDSGSSFQKCRRLIHPYESPPIVCTEYLTADVSTNGVNPVSADFLVVPGSAPSLLGKATATKLGILKIGINHVSQSSAPSADELLAKYPGLCEGIDASRILKSCYT